MTKLSHGRLKKLLRYNKRTGLFTHKIATGGRRKGETPINKPNNTGYIRHGVDGKNYSAHRLAFFYVTGRWPVEVDHKDRNRANNKWSNLREANRSTNTFNSPPRKNTNTGIAGVNYDRDTRTWSARIQCRGVRHHLGFFSSVEEAAKARKTKAEELYGEFNPR